MNFKYPANTSIIKNLTPRYNYFLIIKKNNLINNIFLVEYFVYKFNISISKEKGIKNIKKQFLETDIIECHPLSDTEYETGLFIHPYYKNQNKEPLKFKLKEIPLIVYQK